jgi:KaiC/GvpD/RAD55 family RecA-like ATPase
MNREMRRFGIDPLDDLIGSGLPAGTVTNLIGPPGTGKTRLSLSFISQGILKEEVGLMVRLTSVPIRDLLRSLKDSRRYAPIFQTDEPLIMDLNDLGGADVIIGLIEDGGLQRLVLDHPEVMFLRNPGEWFPILEDLLTTARGYGVSTLITEDISGCKLNVGSYVSEGVIELSRNGGIISAFLKKWDFDPSLEGGKVEEEGVGDWMS